VKSVELCEIAECLATALTTLDPEGMPQYEMRYMRIGNGYGACVQVNIEITSLGSHFPHSSARLAMDFVMEKMSEPFLKEVNPKAKKNEHSQAIRCGVAYRGLLDDLYGGKRQILELSFNYSITWPSSRYAGGTPKALESLAANYTKHFLASQLAPYCAHESRTRLEIFGGGLDPRPQIIIDRERRREKIRVWLANFREQIRPSPRPRGPF
jgi:hypothetical protein